MAYRQFLIFIFSLLSLPAFAGYAQIAAPVAWAAATNTATSGVSQFVYKVAANDAVMFGRTVLVDASLNVGGRAVVMPAALRFAANAPAIAARAMFVNPALAVGIGAAGALAAYYAVGKFYPDVANGGWQKKTDGSACYAPNTCYMWQNSSAGLTSWEYSYQSSCEAGIGHYLFNNYVMGTMVAVTSASDGGCTYTTSKGGTYSGGLGKKVVPPYDFSSMRPATPAEFENYPWPAEFPPGIPAALPVPLPIEMPVINPTPSIAPPAEPNPYPLPVPQPMRVPMGEPQAVPGTDPVQWRSPVVDIVPAPTPAEPWRVDVQPKDITKLSPDPLPDSEPVPVPVPGDPNAPTVTPKADTPPGLCDLFPNILACAKLGDAPAPDTLQNKNIEVSAAAQSGWGGSGSCPAPRQFVVSGKSVEIPFTMVCDFMTGIKPVFVAAAFLAAALILIGRKGGEA